MRLVLRPNLLSIYTDEEETKLKHQISLSEITAVALRKDRKRKGDHEGVFSLFSPSRNFHLESETEDEARVWVDILRREARIDSQDKEMTVTSPSGGQSKFVGFGRTSHSAGRSSMTSGGAFPGSSDAPDSARPSFALSRLDEDSPLPLPTPSYRISHEAYNVSSSEPGSFSDASEGPAFGSLGNLSFSSRYAGHADSSRAGSVLQNTELPESSLPGTRDGKSFYMMGSDAAADDERVLWHGYLQCLKNNRGVRQWKKYWVVLRSKHLALYKSEEVKIQYPSPKLQHLLTHNDRNTPRC